VLVFPPFAFLQPFHFSTFHQHHSSKIAPFPGRTDGINSHYLFHKGSIAGCFTVMEDSKDVLQAGVVQEKERMVFHLFTEDIDETLASVEKYGGTVHRYVSLPDLMTL
jgi:hypothetical protein